MMLARVALRSLNVGLSMRIQRLQIARTLSTNVMPELDNGTSGNQNTNSLESADDFEWRIFNANPSSDPFYEKFDKLLKERDRSGPTFKFSDFNKFDDSVGGLDESFDTLSDGMDGKLKKAATYFDFNPEEIMDDNYSFRPDISFRSSMTYETKDLDLRKPGIRKGFKRTEFEVTTKEVLKKADFRNVRFLANFITDAGIIIKRSQTKISAKAQRKVAREIKTARAFGLMPFTTMGTKSFIFGKTMEGLDQDFEYENFDRSNANAERSQGPMREQV